MGQSWAHSSESVADGALRRDVDDVAPESSSEKSWKLPVEVLLRL